MPFYSPLRYPGGKRRLSALFFDVIESNAFQKRRFVEVYAGGGAVSLALLLEDRIASCWLNDFDYSVYAFWYFLKMFPEELCRRIVDVSVTIEEWHSQRAVQHGERPDILDLGFSTFYLNRTNRSGIILGGVIGGKRQAGPWTLDARFNKENLVERIELIADYSDRISITCVDAAKLLQELEREEDLFIFLDPPYYYKARRLYKNDYIEEDHQVIANRVANLSSPWILTYDDCKEVQQLYRDYSSSAFSLSYSAGGAKLGRELLFSSRRLSIAPESLPALARD